MKTEDVEKGLNIFDKVADLGNKLLNVGNDNIPFLKANQIYIQEIEKNDKLSTSEKMALLYNAGAVKRNMKNLYSVYELTDLMLKEKGSSLETADLDTDSEWFGMFSDIAKNVSDEGMQHIWAKILASKCEDKKSVDKKLLSILQVMEYEDAEIFSYVCANSVITLDQNDGKKYPAFIYPNNVNFENSTSSIINAYDKQILNHSAFTQIHSLGLIIYHTGLSEYGFSGKNGTNMIINYYGDKVIIKSDKKELPIGIIELTRCGCQLVNILHSGQEQNKNVKLVDAIIERYQRLGFEVNRI